MSLSGKRQRRVKEKERIKKWEGRKEGRVEERKRERRKERGRKERRKERKKERKKESKKERKEQEGDLGVGHSMIYGKDIVSVWETPEEE